MLSSLSSRQLLISLLCFGLISCNESSDQTLQPLDEPGDDNQNQKNEFEGSSLEGISLGLFDEVEITISASELSDIEGAQSISIERSELNALVASAEDEIEIAVTPDRIDGPEDVKLNLSTTWQASSFQSSESDGPGEFSIIFRDESNAVTKQIRVPLQVQAVLSISLLGYNGSEYVYSIDNSTIPLCLLSHAGGVILELINEDDVQRTFHGEGMIDHGSRLIPGGVFSQIVTSTANGTGTFYQHGASPADTSRNSIRFNSSEEQRANPGQCRTPVR